MTVDEFYEKVKPLRLDGRRWMEFINEVWLNHPELREVAEEELELFLNYHGNGR